MNILVLGSGGREHAIAWALSKSPRCDELFVAPGNGGTAAVATNVNDVDMMSGSSVLSFVREHGVDLVVVGPEAPLVAGVADELRDAGISVFGPDAAGALLEGSKAHSKAFMEKNDIPTVSRCNCSSVFQVKAFCCVKCCHTNCCHRIKTFLYTDTQMIIKMSFVKDCLRLTVIRTEQASSAVLCCHTFKQCSKVMAC